MWLLEVVACIFAAKLILFAWTASAADGTGAASSGFLGGLLSGLLTEQVIGAAVGGLLTLLAGVLVKFAHNEVRRRNVAIAIRHAYAAVEEIARLDPADNAIDKIAAGLKSADAWMSAQGWRPLTEQEKQVARLGFTAISGDEHARTKLATAANIAAQLALKEVLPVPQSPRAI